MFLSLELLVVLTENTYNWLVYWQVIALDLPLKMGPLKTANPENKQQKGNTSAEGKRILRSTLRKEFYQDWNYASFMLNCLWYVSRYHFIPAAALHLHFLRFHLPFILERRENLLSGYTHSGALGFKKLLKSSVATMSKGTKYKM